MRVIQGMLRKSKARVMLAMLRQIMQDKKKVEEQKMEIKRQESVVRIQAVQRGKVSRQESAPFIQERREFVAVVRMQRLCRNAANRVRTRMAAAALIAAQKLKEDQHFGAIRIQAIQRGQSSRRANLACIFPQCIFPQPRLFLSSLSLTIFPLAFGIIRDCCSSGAGEKDGS